MFDRQSAFVDSPHKRKVVRPGRRSGKTHGLTACALRAAQLHPNTVVPVFERTLSCTAADTFWRSLQDFEAQFSVGMVFHHTAKTATVPNRSTIALLGADTLEAADKHRGGKFAVALVDEAGTFRSKVLSYLLTEVISPATIDLDGTIIVAGTPGLDMNGTFYDLSQSKEWEQHHWTLLDNPTIGPKELDAAARRAWRAEWLRRERALNSWTEASAKYLREYMGVWASDAEDRMYPLNRDLNILPALPDPKPGAPWLYILGMDLGFNDPTAFVVLARRRGDPRVYVVRSYEQEGLIPSAVAAHVERLHAEFHFVHIVADTGGYGKAVAEEMKATYRLPIEAAEKRDKRVFVEHAAGELKSGKIAIIGGTNRELIDDLFALPWNDDRTDAAPKYRDHLADALLYGLRAARKLFPSAGLGEYDPRSPGSPEWWQEREEALIAQLEAECLREREDDAWPDLGVE